MKKVKIIIFSFLVFMVCSHTTMLAQGVSPEMKHFQDSKFGLFVHWGLYSQTAGLWKGKAYEGGEHFMMYERIPLKEYGLIANDFNPTSFDAKQWVKIAKKAGMKYIVYTTKHHDGFAMYNSQCSDYNIVKRTPYGRDPLKELAEACHQEGLGLGLYYSLGRDWEDPDVPTNWPKKAGRSNTWDYPNEDAKQLPRYVERKVKPQLRELLTNYGTIDMVWFDTFEMITKDQSQEIRDLIKSIQPHCLINNRIGGGKGDYNIVEQQLVGQINLKPWEACLTMGKNWGYSQLDTIYKAPDEMIRHLADIVSKGGNLLLNIGPTGKGSFPVQTQPGLKEFGVWLKANGEAIYGTRPWTTFGENQKEGTVVQEEKKDFHDAEFDGTPKDFTPDFRFTAKDGKVYVIARHVTDKAYLIKAVTQATKVKKVTLLENGKAVKWKQTEAGLQIDMATIKSTRSPVYVLKIE